MSLTKEQIESQLAADQRGIEVLVRRAARLAERLEKIKDRPADEFEDGAILTFQKRFRPGTHVFTFAAVKAAGGWYLAGRSSDRLTWDTLCDYMQDGLDGKVWVATEWQEVEGL